MAGKLTYQQAVVDTRRAASLVGDIKGHVKRTQQNRKLLGAFGLFAACYDLSDYDQPVIVTGCDGVGTKLEFLLEHDMLETAGKDLVAMSVNDILIGYPSNSIHANGWSLVRRALKEIGPGVVTDEELHAWLEPTRLYDDVVNDLKKSGVKPKAMAHITGGGLPENLERLFVGMGADLEIPEWNLLGIGKLLENVDAEDRFHTFNMGIGWVVIVDATHVETTLKAGPGGHILGQMRNGDGVHVKVAE